MRAALLAVTLMSLALAGCASQADVPAAPTPTASPTATAGAGKLANATTFDFSTITMAGQTPAGGCFFSAISQCQFQGGSGYEQVLSVQGHGLSVEGNASLSSATPLSNIQVILFATVNGTEDLAPGNDTLQDGPSPLHFKIDLSHFPAGTPFTLRVYSVKYSAVPPEPAPAAGFAIVNVPQDFILKATLKSEVPAGTSTVVR